MDEASVVKRRRGRPPGICKPNGPQRGSRNWLLNQLEIGESCLFETEAGNSLKLMQQLGAGFARTLPTKRFTQELVLGVFPHTRKVIDIVRVTRLEDKQHG